MKILLPYVNVSGGSITDTKISGGTELFSKLIYDNFDVVVCEIPWTTTNDDNKKIINKIKNLIDEYKIDIILSNNIKSVCLYALRNLGVPIMHITHTNYGLFSAAKILNAMVDHGHSLYGVSQFNIDYLKNQSQRILNKDLKFSGIIQPSYAMYNKEVVLNPSIDFITVGRANSYKAPFKVHNLLHKTSFSYQINTSVGLDEDSIEYYERNKNHPHDLNKSHSDIIDEIRNSYVSCITCPKETFGIVGLESLSLGVPVIIFAKQGVHATAEIPVSSEHYRIIDGSKDALIRAYTELIQVDRNEIKRLTQEKYSLENWKTTIMNALINTLDTYQKSNTKQANTLNDLF